MGDDDSMAAAYTLHRVLKAVTEVGSMSAFAATPDAFIVAGVAATFVWRDSLGLLGDDC